MALHWKILANNDDDLYSSYRGSIPLSQLFEGVPYEKVALILAGGSELIKTAMDISFTPDISTMYAVEIRLSWNDDIPDYNLDDYNHNDYDDVDDDAPFWLRSSDDGDDDDDDDDDGDDDDDDDDDVTWNIHYDYDTHWDCDCKTRPVCGCGCDPLHDGW